MSCSTAVHGGGLWHVPRMWPQSTVVCLATGPSLTPAVVAHVANWRESGEGRFVIAINDAYRLAPWADVLYACDGSWWEHHEGARGYTGGLKVSGTRHGEKWGAMWVQESADFREGLSDDPTKIASGGNSGYQAVNLAYLLGAARIVLVGYDCQPDDHGRLHFFGSHTHTQVPPPFSLFLAYWPTIAGPLADRGVDVVNATPGSAIDCFPRATLEEALC